MYSIKEPRVLLSQSLHDFSSDKRILIPFEQYGKFGFMNRNAEIVVEPIYDFLSGEFYTETDQIVVGVLKHRVFPNGDKPKLYSKLAYGVMDATGQLILATDYARIIFSDDRQYITAQTYECTGYIVYSNKGEVVVAEKEYYWIDGFWNGFTRVIRNSKFGVIDTKNQIILPIEYDNIWNFYDKDYNTIVVEKDKISNHISFDTLNRISNPNMAQIIEGPDFCDRWFDDYEEPQTYGEYEGSYVQDVLGWSDQMIGDALDGEPDAYWNID